MNALVLGTILRFRSFRGGRMLGIAAFNSECRINWRVGSGGLYL